MTTQVRVALGAIVLYFGSSLPAYKLASESFGPATTNLIRFVVAAGMLGALGRRRIPRDPQTRRRLFLIGLLGLGLMAVLMSIGVDEGSAIIGSVVVGLEPIGVALAGMLLAGDRVSRRTLVALVVGFSGALVASGLFTERTGPSPLLPVLLLLGTVTTFSIYTAFVRTAGRGVDPLAIASMTQIGALAFVIPACVFDLVHRNDAGDVPGWLTPVRGMVRGPITAKALLAALFIVPLPAFDLSEEDVSRHEVEPEAPGSRSHGAFQEVDGDEIRLGKGLRRVLLADEHLPVGPHPFAPDSSSRKGASNAAAHEVCATGRKAHVDEAAPLRQRVARSGACRNEQTFDQLE